MEQEILHLALDNIRQNAAFVGMFTAGISSISSFHYYQFRFMELKKMIVSLVGIENSMFGKDFLP